MDEHEVEARDIYEEFRGILGAGHPGAVYLPWFYRSAPPYVFLFDWGVCAVVGRSEIENGSFRSAVFRENDYVYVQDSCRRMDYRFAEGRDFSLLVEGGELAKELEGEAGWLRELSLFHRNLGFFRLAPLVRMEEMPARGGAALDTAPVLRIKRLAEGLPLPAYAHPGDAGLDLTSAEGLTIEPGEFAMVPAGFAMALPEGYAAFVQPRSGLAAKHGISIVNTPGLIDCHYRGEVKIILINHGKEPFRISRGDRVAQLVIQRVETPRVEVVEELDETRRGEGGFGSTGL